MKPARCIVAEYDRHERLVAVLRRLRNDGYSQFEVYSPFPSDEVDALLPAPPTPMGWIMLAAGIGGAIGAYFLQWYAARDYPYNSGGRPLDSWPAFVPVTFELTVLTAALVGLAALLWLTRLPRLDHPMFALPRFSRASQDRFFVAIHSTDPRFTMAGLEKLLRDSQPLAIEEVEP
jgi:hypothetical protein